MLMFDGALGVVALGVWVFCIIDVITTPDTQVRNLPKLLWLLLVVLLVDIGAIAWLAAGRPWSERSARAGTQRTRPGGAPTRARTPARPSNPDDDDEFLAGLQARADEQRRRAREAQQGDDSQDGPTPAS